MMHSPSCKNSDLLILYLKTEAGYPGLVFLDQDSQSTALGSANAGFDFEGSRIWSNSTIAAGLANGTLSQERLDDMMWPYRMLWDTAMSTSAMEVSLLMSALQHTAIVGPTTVMFFASFQAIEHGHLRFTRRSSYDETGMIHEGRLAVPSLVVLAVEAIDNSRLWWKWNCTKWRHEWNLGGGGDDNSFGGERGGAAGLSVCLVFLKIFSGKGADRTEFRDTDQDILVTSVAAGFHRTVVIISTVRARIVNT
ncbi:uncharacterized protein EAF02_008739 [Botrytis sinoallii]|uniref:uncharacterized protein n=1 Tax=Botrytis sinoallii TaxID=1463999 RepID=UPI001902351A|nr:uncharacterized protein EAF02_008739 [Botrytis sinoallii]KAF7872668.1 hypothetical protein EAF02_008739 [Botrytis sinoallii]